MKTLGILVTVLGGIAAIGMSIFMTKELGSLWALILLGWGVQYVSASRNSLAGIVLGVLYGALGLAIFYIPNPSILWAMILANWLIPYLPSDKKNPPPSQRATAI